ncbi:hypothetical protein Athai_28260 [Actinocatenispora thailandica]|uniref:Neutral/alkaline non-lysosomal ceramidase N-terminal domain-containing protein n=1 Tax=Actinocatenispora thailandica TaxID=227318 RepID=A0A7R7DPB9_9ACTN|nr:hypothetical protein [Actinocatenispora thailandica]BCJ35323.1 hypothetical protein Athai_28260 [Actinocatenispora thailandica]
MRTGFAAVPLPVTEPTPMGGYAGRVGVSAGTRDPLQLSALTWSDGHHRLALVLADLICVNADVVAAARAAVTGVDALWLAASHTHSGPETGCVPGGTATPPPWSRSIPAAVAGVVDRAVRAEADSVGRWRTGILTDVGSVRSEAATDARVPLDLVEVLDTAGDRAGLLVVLPVHPTVLSADNLLVSADLVGAVRAALAERLGPDIWVAVATGTAGDISTRHTRRGHGGAELKRLAAAVADHCLAELARPAVPAWGAADRWDGRARRTLLTPKPSSAADRQAMIAAATEAVAAARHGGDPATVRIAEGDLTGARLASTIDGPEHEIEAEVAVARIGALAVAALPGEPFLALGETIRRSRPGPTAVLGYANGYPGYLPTRDAYRRARYEVLAAAAAPGSGERLAGIAADLLTDLDGAHQ